MTIINDVKFKKVNNVNRMEIIPATDPHEVPIGGIDYYHQDPHMVIFDEMTRLGHKALLQCIEEIHRLK